MKKSGMQQKLEYICTEVSGQTGNEVKLDRKKMNWLIDNTSLLIRLSKTFNEYHEDDEDLDGFYHDFRRAVVFDHVDRKEDK